MELRRVEGKRRRSFLCFGELPSLDVVDESFRLDVGHRLAGFAFLDAPLPEIAFRDVEPEREDPAIIRQILPEEGWGDVLALFEERASAAGADVLFLIVGVEVSVVEDAMAVMAFRAAGVMEERIERPHPQKPTDDPRVWDEIGDTLPFEFLRLGKGLEEELLEEVDLDGLHLTPDISHEVRGPIAPEFALEGGIDLPFQGGQRLRLALVPDGGEVLEVFLLAQPFESDFLEILVKAALDLDPEVLGELLPET